MIDRELFRQICTELRHPELDRTFLKPTNVVVAEWVGLPPETPAVELIVALGAALAEIAHEAAADRVSERFAAQARGAARSRGRRTSLVLTSLQRQVSVALTALGDAASDTEVLADLRRKKLVPLTTRSAHIKRCRASLLRRADALAKS